MKKTPTHSFKAMTKYQL